MRYIQIANAKSDKSSDSYNLKGNLDPLGSFSDKNQSYYYKSERTVSCKALAFIIEKSISDKLEQFIADTKLSKTATVEKALEEYIEKYNKTGKI